MTKVIKVVTESDYENYFTQWVHGVAQELSDLPDHNIDTLEVSAGPYRSYGLDIKVDKNANKASLDFYSAIRTGFGSIGCTQKEAAEYIAKY